MPSKPRPKQGMRIAELARRSDTSKETIHFYLREGLLRKPKKTSRNMAYYDETHVEQLKLIKRLRSESYLPLNVIKKVLKQGKLGTSARRLDLSGDLLGQGARATFEPLTRKELCERTGLPERRVAAYEEQGLLRPTSRPKRYGWDDVRLAEIIAEAETEGGQEGQQLVLERFSIIETHLERLVKEEVAHFFGRVVTGGDPKNALTLLQGGRETIGRFMAIARARRLREEVESMMPAIEQAVRSGEPEPLFRKLEDPALERLGAVAHQQQLKDAGEVALWRYRVQICAPSEILENADPRALKDDALRSVLAEAYLLADRFDEAFELAQALHEDEAARTPLLSALWGTLVLVRIREKFGELQSSTELIGYLARAFAAFDAARLDEQEPELVQARVRLYLGRIGLATPGFLGVKPRAEKDLLRVLELVDKARAHGEAPPGVVETLELNAAHFLARDGSGVAKADCEARLSRLANL